MESDQTRKVIAYLIAALYPESLQKIIENGSINDGKLSVNFSGNKRIRRTLPDKPIEEICTDYLVTSMLASGYVWFPVENGYIVISPDGEEYQIIDSQCTCPHYINKSEKCKHLMLTEWFIRYRAIQGQAKQKVQKR